MARRGEEFLAPRFTAPTSPDEIVRFIGLRIALTSLTGSSRESGRLQDAIARVPELIEVDEQVIDGAYASGGLRMVPFAGDVLVITTDRHLRVVSRSAADHMAFRWQDIAAIGGKKGRLDIGLSDGTELRFKYVEPPAAAEAIERYRSTGEADVFEYAREVEEYRRKGSPSQRSSSQHPPSRAASGRETGGRPETAPEPSPEHKGLEVVPPPDAASPDEGAGFGELSEDGPADDGPRRPVASGPSSADPRQRKLERERRVRSMLEKRERGADELIGLERGPTRAARRAKRDAERALRLMGRGVDELETLVSASDAASVHAPELEKTILDLIAGMVAALDAISTGGDFRAATRLKPKPESTARLPGRV
jgi:hypothetical protein